MDLALGRLIFFVCLLVVLIAAAVIVGYYLLYKSFINRRIQNRSDNERGMWPPRNVFWATVCVALILLTLFGLLMSVRLHRNDRAEFSPYTVIAMPTEECLDGYLSLFSTEENAGYTRYVKEEGGVRFTYFLSYEEYDALHPAFILFAEPTEDAAAVGYKAAFGRRASKEETSLSADTPLIVIGNAPPASVFEIDVYYYDEAGTDALTEGENDGNAAIAHGTLRIAMHE